MKNWALRMQHLLVYDIKIVTIISLVYNMISWLHFSLKHCVKNLI